MLKIVWKALCISLISCTAFSVPACERYGLPSTTLVGTVTLETFYGPPGYGVIVHNQVLRRIVAAGERPL